MTAILTLTVIFLMGSLFGIALASSIIVHPILKTISKPAAIEIFKPFFDKTHKIVLYLSLLVSLLALFISIQIHNWWWFGLSALMHLNGPYTLKFMMPTNKRLMATNVDPNGTQTQKDLINWGKLHALRTLWIGLIFLGYLVLFIYRLDQ